MVTPKNRPPLGFTLIELLVVISIILLVSVLAIPAALQEWHQRALLDATRLVHASLREARTEAARLGAPVGVRFAAPPRDPGYADRVSMLVPGPDYSEGLVTTTDPATLPPGFFVPYPCLMIEQAPFTAPGRPAPATSWWYNVRVGDRIRIGRTGSWYTVVGPVNPAVPTAERFVAPVQPLDRGDGAGPLDYLWLVNGIDDNDDGFVDSGWDGYDNDNDGVTDEPDEWELETWRQTPVAAASYTLRRRPVPSVAKSSYALPRPVVVDLASAPAELMIDPLGGAVPSGPYGVPTRLPLKDHVYRIRLIDRDRPDNEAWVTIDARLGTIDAIGPDGQ